MADVLFMGTPPFAVASLEAIIKAGHNIVGVVTTPDKQAGRGLKKSSSAVCIYAKEHQLTLFQPENLNDDVLVCDITALKPDVIVVVAFRKIPKSIYIIPKYGTFNVHASLLPQYRGAAPINHAIINGETQTGITTFLLDDNIDTGKIICREKIDIGSNETAGELHDKLMVLGAQSAVKTIDMLLAGDTPTIDQNTLLTGESNMVIHKAPKLTKEFCKLNWTKDTMSVYNKIRGLSPYPCAYTEITNAGGNTLSLKIFSSTPTIQQHTHGAGEITCDNINFLGIYTSDGIIYLEDVQQAGRKRMSIKDFLRGTKIMRQD